MRDLYSIILPCKPDDEVYVITRVGRVVSVQERAVAEVVIRNDGRFVRLDTPKNRRTTRWLTFEQFERDAFPTRAQAEWEVERRKKNGQSLL